MRTCFICVLFSLTSMGCAPKGTGVYDLDTASYAASMAEQIIELGDLDADREEELRQRLRNTRYTLDLRPDRTFVGVVQRESTRMTFRGKWHLDVVTISLLTQEVDGKRRNSEMEGTLIDGHMHVRAWDELAKRHFPLQFDRRAE